MPLHGLTEGSVTNRMRFWQSNTAYILRYFCHCEYKMLLLLGNLKSVCGERYEFHRESIYDPARITLGVDLWGQNYLWSCGVAS